MRMATRVVAGLLVLMFGLATHGAKARTDEMAAHLKARHQVHVDGMGYNPNSMLCNTPAGGCMISLVVR